MTTLSFPWPLSRTATDDTVTRDEANDWKGRPLRRQSSFLGRLTHYDGPGARPPSARMDASMKQREGQPFSLWNLLKLGPAAALKTAEVATDILKHTVFGPRRKTWPVEMTIVSSFMRNAGRHSHLVDIATMRLLIGLGGLVPLPSDAMVTPVTFRVRRRALRGILAEYDAAEDGRRELQGEWVVGKRLWRRLQAEWRAAQRGAAPDDAEKMGTGKGKGRVVLFLHGGAYYCFSAATHRLITIPLSKYADARVFAVDYRLAPETRFPGPLHDAVSAYLRLVEDLNIPPENILIAGDSAGGGLSLALLMYLRDNNYPLPSGAILMSPWVDLTMSCDSWESNAPFDVVPAPAPGDHLNPIHCYLGDHMEKYLTHPYASPLFGDFRGLPPMLIQAGEAEVLRDEITLLAHKATLAGVQVMHELYEDAVHVFQAFPFLDASTRAFLSCREFVRAFLPTAHAGRGHSPKPLGANAGLAAEIDNERTRPVAGDGSEDAGPPAVNVGAEKEKLATGEPSSGLGNGSDEEDPSWAPSQGHVQSPQGTGTWPSPPPSDDEGEEPYVLISRRGSARAKSAVKAPAGKQPKTPTPVQPPLARSDSRPALARIHSSLSSFMLQNYNASSAAGDASNRPAMRRMPSTPTPTPPAHSRASSWALSSTMSASARPPTGRPRNSTVSVRAPPPRPSIRSSASHADISSLCAQWASAGPANETMMVKHDGRVQP